MRITNRDTRGAILGAVGVAGAWRAADHRAIARHPRYVREGWLYG